MKFGVGVDMKKFLVVLALLISAKSFPKETKPFVFFGVDFMPYYKPNSFVSGMSVSQFFGVRVASGLYAGFFQEMIKLSIQESGNVGSANVSVSGLSLEYSAVELAGVDGRFGVDLASGSTAGSGAVGNVSVPAYTTMLSDVFVSIKYPSNKKASMNVKIGFRFLPIPDGNRGTDPDFDDLNGLFFKIGFGVNF